MFEYWHMFHILDGYSTKITDITDPPDQELEEGSGRRFKCLVTQTGYPTTTLPPQWYHEGKVLTPSDRIMMLDTRMGINELKRTDEGNYTCHLLNIFVFSCQKQEKHYNGEKNNQQAPCFHGHVTITKHPTFISWGMFETFYPAFYMFYAPTHFRYLQHLIC